MKFLINSGVGNFLKYTVSEMYRVSIKFRKKLNGSHLQKKASSELIFLAKDSAIFGVYEKDIKNNAFINLNCLIAYIN